MRKKRGPDPQPPPAGGAVLTVNVESKGPLTTVRALLDGQPVESAEVQWFPNTPFRAAPGGVTAMKYGDPRLFKLTAQWGPAILQYRIIARVKSVEDYVYSDPVEAAVQI